MNKKGDNAGDAGFGRQTRAWFRKTEKCRFFIDGCCAKGSNCDFAHGDKELRTVPDLSKTAMCKAWAQGKCTLSTEECPFAHSMEQLKNSRKGLRLSQMKKNMCVKAYGMPMESKQIKEEKAHGMMMESHGTVSALDPQGVDSGQAFLPMNCIKEERAYDMPMESCGMKSACDLSPLQPVTGHKFQVAPEMFCALPPQAQHALARIGLKWTHARYTVFATIDLEALHHTLVQAMPDFYDD